MAFEHTKVADWTGGMTLDAEDLEQNQYKRDISVILKHSLAWDGYW